MWGLLVFLVGLLYGALKRGRQDKSSLFMQGLVIGIVLAIVLVVLGLLVNVPAIVGLGGAFGIIVTAIILSLLFVLGVWVGDLVSGARRQTV